jgi:hypothetical protein
MIRYLAPTVLGLLLFAGTAGARPVVDEATADCIVSEAPRPVKALLETVPGSGAEVEAVRAIADSFRACSGGTKALSPDVDGSLVYALRSDLAEALLRTGPLVNLPASASAAIWFDTASVSATLRARHAFGVCLIAADPAATAQFIRAYPGTPQAKRAMGALRSKVAGCVPQGSQLKISAADLRQMLAEPLYHNVIARPRG